jgi:Killing trait
MSANSQIADSITQVNTKVLGDAPANAMGNLFQATAQALANAAHNATGSQQQSYITMQASTVRRDDPLQRRYGVERPGQVEDLR